MARSPNPAAQQILALYRAGVRKVEIARSLGVTDNVVNYYLRGEPLSRKPKEVKIVKRSKPARFRYPDGGLRPGYRFGRVTDIPPEVEPIVVRHIKGDESILACLCRLVIQRIID